MTDGRHRVGVCFSVLVAVALAGCGPTGGLADRDSALAHRMVEQEGALLLDVRTAEEYTAGHIDGATHIAVQELGERLAEIDAATGGDKQHGIVLYCKSGRRAGIAKQMLLDRGYTRVTNLGGYTDW